ncbi:hypothetical protein LCGC14_1108460 [marine sediment metagenome]|uniref:Uncharacterized protein n=1 Tax=marine sediment metagenome TaxID=412755 RepID=A0A0F9M7I3_9ZZZZ
MKEIAYEIYLVKPYDPNIFDYFVYLVDTNF